MSPGGKAARRKREAVVGGVDYLSALAVDLRLKVMSLLPSRDAVRTSVLARSWRNQWQEVRSLRATDDRDFHSENDLNKFINHLLILRDRKPLVPLDVVDIKSYGYQEFDHTEAFRYIDVWIRRALQLQVQELRVCITSEEIMEEEDNIELCPLPDKLITSEYLTKLELTRVQLQDNSLYFSS